MTVSPTPHGRWIVGTKVRENKYRADNLSKAVGRKMKINDHCTWHGYSSEIASHSYVIFTSEWRQGETMNIDSLVFF